MGPRRASSLLAVLTIVASCYCCLTQAFLFPTGSYHGPSIVTTGKRRGGSPFTTETRRQIGPGWMPDSQKTMTPDEEIMEALIKMEWDDLEAFSNQHYKYLIHPQFYMKLADRIYELPTQAEQDEAAAKATKIWNRLLKVLEAAESVRASTAEVLEKIVAQAAESDGAFLFPLTKDRAVRAEVLKNLDRLDEGALTTLNSWMLKVQDDKDNAAMTEVLQRVFQFYAGGVLMRAKGYDRTGSDVLGAPMRYFDTTPLGSLVQRFSSDLDQVDQQLPGTLGMFITCVFQLVGTLGAILAATPKFAFALFPVSWIYLSVMNYFRAVTRELKRLDSLSRSPIYSHFSETLGGLSVIRAFRKEKAFIRANECKVDQNVRAYISLKAADRWLSVRLELLGACVVALGAVLAVQGAAVGKLGAGLAGLALTNALGVTGLLNWAVRCLAETEAMMNSVERVQQLVDSVPSEAPRVLSSPSHATGAASLETLQHSAPANRSTDGGGIASRPIKSLQDDALL
ncbi:hypothetical protein VYU27_009987, partial [Nannochloropsis oceanica]